MCQIAIPRNALAEVSAQAKVQSRVISYRLSDWEGRDCYQGEYLGSYKGLSIEYFYSAYIAPIFLSNLKRVELFDRVARGSRSETTRDSRKTGHNL